MFWAFFIGFFVVYSIGFYFLIRNASDGITPWDTEETIEYIEEEL